MPPSFCTGSLYTAVVVQGLCVNGAIPLYYELAIECTYPITEVVSSGMMTIIYQIGPLLFLLVFLIPHIGKENSVSVFHHSQSNVNAYWSVVLPVVWGSGVWCCQGCGVVECGVARGVG